MGTQTRQGRELSRVSKTVVFADVVGSVRLMETDEEGAINRWLDFTRHVREQILPSRNGRLVKRLGDGLMLEFDTPVDAVRAAFDALENLRGVNDELPVQLRQELRIGMHAGDVLSGGDEDLYGHGVNIASRIMSQAQPGDVVATVNVRDAIAGQLDVDLEDMGDFYLRHVLDPVRIFRLSPPGRVRRIPPILSVDDLLPTVAVVPFRHHAEGGLDDVLGDVLAEEIIVALSGSRALNVTSRLSTRHFRDGIASLPQIGQGLRADFVLSGTYRGNADRLVIDLELAEVRSERVVWSRRIAESMHAILADPSHADALASAVQEAIVRAQVRRARSSMPPTLENYSLLMAAESLMHRPSRRDFLLAHELMKTLMQRSSETSPIILAAMARWHVLSVQQGWTDSPMREANEALHLTNGALDIDPTNVPALISQGFVLTNLVHRLDEAAEIYDLALDLNPNEATGHLLRGVNYAFRGDGENATRDTERALHLAPLDPHRYFFESLAASACIANNDNERALALANQSLRANRGHTSTWRVKAVAELRLGQEAAARATVAELLRQQPTLTISGWLKTSPSADFAVGRAFAKSLSEAGVPD